MTPTLSTYHDKLDEVQASIHQHLSDTIRDNEYYLPPLLQVLRKLQDVNQKMNDATTSLENRTTSTSGDLQEQVHALYQHFTGAKVDLASALMVGYWLSDDTWRAGRTIPVDNLQVCHTALQTQVRQTGKDEIPDDLSLQRYFETIVEETRRILEKHFSKDEFSNLIFDIVYEDYRANEELRTICDYLGGEATNKQIPAQLPNLGITDLWTRISNNFWTGSSKIVTSYFKDFVTTIYKCAGETHKFIITESVASIRQRLHEDPDATVRYLDLATGTNGTIAVGVYTALAEEEHQRVEFYATDSSDTFITDLAQDLQDKQPPINIQVGVQNMANPHKIQLLKDGKLQEEQEFAPGSFDVISQNLGGHHLPKQQQRAMYEGFISLLKPGGYLATGDVHHQPLKLLAGLPDDIGAPEYPYDVRQLPTTFPSLHLVNSGPFPRLHGTHEGFYTCALLQKRKDS